MRQFSRTRTVATLAVLAAVAYLVTVVTRVPFIPAAPFLKYDPKDVIVAISGFIFGPLAAFAVSTAVCLVEMVTVSESGPIGMVMEVLASCSFACVAAFVYYRRRTMTRAFIGLALGWVCMIAVMLLWNYFLTPVYLGMPRESVVAMFLPVIIPFNAIKGGLNAGIILLAYKPVMTALRKARLLPASRMPAAGGADGRTAAENAGAKTGFRIGPALVAVFVIASCVLFILALQNRI
ncbi:MAG: ECF transporter S component [Firmicutes bacterium]|nr:ECF transporter S component [Bacillota bacterium]